ncbi:MAG: hypothetical protein OXH92_08275 [Bryobacterales bacterium]|nr:hypothetical protein [Bryobacterales bacterium]
MITGNIADFTRGACAFSNSARGLFGDQGKPLNWLDYSNKGCMGLRTDRWMIGSMMRKGTMAIFRVSGGEAVPVAETSFQSEGILERRDLQSMFRKSIGMLVPDALVLAEEFGDWEDSRRRVDLLCLDRSARLVVVELKRSEDGGHMELQAIRYASMVSHMTFAAAVRAHQRFLDDNRIEGDADQRILEHLGWEEPQEEEFASEIAIVLASAEFSKELTTAVIWLSEHDIDIRCIKLKPYKLGKEVLVDVVQIFPLPEAADYQIRLKAKEREERRLGIQNRDLTRYRLNIGDEIHDNLPKRRLAFLVIREAVNRGAEPLEVYPDGSWLIVAGHQDEDGVLIMERDERSSKSNARRFFTKDDELFRSGGKTYAITKMWGEQTLTVVDRIVRQFNMDDVFYQAIE